MRSIGYQQVWSYLEQEIDHAALVEDVGTATRRLAKRQLTWMRNEPGWTWFDALGPGLFEGVRKYLAGTGSSLTGDRVEI
jgi:tRNA dimethylallyltransferase